MRCPSCNRVLDDCEDGEDCEIYVCNNVECKYSFVYMFSEKEGE